MSLLNGGRALLPLRIFVGIVFLYAGISKIADRRFLDSSSPISIHAQVVAVKRASPIGGLLGPVVEHSFAFGLFMAFAEIAVGLGVLLGLLTRVAAAGGMLVALSLWLTASWQAEPWYTSADVVYLFALTPLLLGGAGELSLDRWLAAAPTRHRGGAEGQTRRTLVIGGLALFGVLLGGVAAAFRRPPSRAASEGPAGSSVPGDSSSPSSSPVPTGGVLTTVSDVPVGGATQVQDPNTGRTDWVLQLSSGRFTAFDSTCPHQGCAVTFESAASGFVCPCHGSRFDPSGKVIDGPAPSGLTPVPVRVVGGEVRLT